MADSSTPTPNQQRRTCELCGGSGTVRHPLPPAARIEFDDDDASPVPLQDSNNGPVQFAGECVIPPGACSCMCHSKTLGAAVKHVVPCCYGARATPVTSEQRAETEQMMTDYASGRWCGECRWRVVEEPPCCFIYAKDGD